VAQSYFILIYFCFICSLINGALSNSYYIASNDWMIVKNELKKCEGSGSGLILRYYHSLGGLKKTIRTSVGIASVLAEIRNGRLPNRSLHFYRLS
jgi:hypothetical protein